MWKLRISKSFETEYANKMLPGLVLRVKAWKGNTSFLYKYFRSELLPDWNKDHPVKTDILKRLLIAKPTEAHALNEQLMKKLVSGYSEADLEQKNLPKNIGNGYAFWSVYLIMMENWVARKAKLIG